MYDRSGMKCFSGSLCAAGAGACEMDKLAQEIHLLTAGKKYFPIRRLPCLRRRRPCRRAVCG